MKNPHIALEVHNGKTVSHAGDIFIWKNNKNHQRYIKNQWLLSLSEKTAAFLPHFTPTLLGILDNLPPSKNCERETTLL